MWLPSPVLARSSSADWMLVKAYMPAAMSAMELPALLGVSGVPLGVPEVEPALSTGRINACYGSPLAAVALQWNTKVKYMTSMPLSYAIGATVTKLDVLNKISADDQKLIRQAAKDSVGKMRELWSAREKVSEDKVRAAGVNVIKVNKEEFAAIYGG